MPPEEIAHAIVVVAKPYDSARATAAKDVVASYLDHPNAWVRHEAMWFLTSWAGFVEYEPALLRALREDPDPDNRDAAALFLGHLQRGTGEPEAIRVLSDFVADETRDEVSRLTAYGALLQVAKNERGIDFQTSEKGLAGIDWKWIEELRRGAGKSPATDRNL